MKKIIFLILINSIFLTVLKVCADEEKLSQKLERFYWQQKSEEVYTFAEERLKGNPDDLVGLLIEMGKATVEYDINQITKIQERLDKVASQINTSEFGTRYNYWVKKGLPSFLNIIKKWPKEKVEEFRKVEKHTRPEIFPLIKFIGDLEKENLISNQGDLNKPTLEKFKENEKSKKTRFSERLNKLWEDKELGEIFIIGEERLKKDPNDLVGLIVEIQKAMISCNAEDMSNLYSRLNRIALKINTPRFKDSYVYWSKAIPFIIDDLKKYSKEELANIKKKHNDNPEPFSMLNYLIQALEEDGLIDENGQPTKTLLEKIK